MNLPLEIDNIYAGDARELSKSIEDESADMVLTDPPFGINFKYSNGYDDNPAEYLDLVKWIVAESNRIIKPGGLCFVYQAQSQIRYTLPLFPESSRIFASCKNFVQMRDIPVQFSYEPSIFWQKEGKLLKSPYFGRDYHVANTACTNNRGLKEAGFHSCPRPLDTIQYMVRNFSPENGLVVDFFMGSGTTAVACKIEGRHWLGFELDAQTAELANERVLKTPYSIFSTLPVQSEMF